MCGFSLRKDMSFQQLYPKDGTTISKVVCAVAFCLFSFSYLFFYQADTLAVAQHALSGGTTRYNGLIGAVLITVVLFILQVGVYALTRLGGGRHALTYFPSLLALAIVTSAGPGIVDGFSMGAWCWLAPLLLVAWGGCIYVAEKIPYGKPAKQGLFSHDIWTNVFSLCAMFIFVGAAGNGNEVFHYRMRIENRFRHGDFSSVVEVGRRSMQTDSNLTMLRAYALARNGQLGDKLFTYPVECKGEDLVPMPNGTRCLMYCTDSIYRYLGARPLARHTTASYLDALLKSRKATAAVKDYVLCSCLVNRDIDAFARMLPLFYKVDSTLPRHYREALTLYTHSRSNPSVVFRDDVMDTDFNDLQALEKRHPDMLERRLAVFDQYRGTYWWYYEYGGK